MTFYIAQNKRFLETPVLCLYMVFNIARKPLFSETFTTRCTSMVLYTAQKKISFVLFDHAVHTTQEQRFSETFLLFDV